MRQREIICKTCGKALITIRSRDVKYCSQRCAWANKDRVRNIRGLWSESDVKALINAYKRSGTTRDVFLSNIAIELKRTRIAVCIKARRIGLTTQHRHPTKKQKENFGIDMQLYYNFHEHPRGRLGWHMTKEERKRHGDALRGKKLNLTPKQRRAMRIRGREQMAKRLASGEAGNVYSRCKRGRAKDLADIFFRSKWERNYARYLKWLVQIGEIKRWEYEPQRFDFIKIRRGCTSYLPDFRITNNNGTIQYHEVKGWMDKKSKTKLKRMAKYFPEVDLIIIGEKQYKEIQNKVGKLIPHWE